MHARSVDDPISTAPSNADRLPSVLVVDDNADAAHSTAVLLSLSGFAVAVATDGEVALRIATADRPDAVLLDLKMPGMDGWELARRLTEPNGGQRPFLIAVTGCAMDDDRRRSDDVGINVHLVKPVDPVVLIDLLTHLGSIPVPTATS